jgi:hypothetical protein
MNKFKIEDKASLEWIRIKGYCEQRVAELHEENEADLDEVETANIRGKIAMAKAIMALDQTEIAAEVIDTHYIE